jgi:3-hydroxybutyryl-CoA dehydrogenase
MEIKKVGVLGCGLMGSGIAQTAATAGYETIVREVSDDLIAKGFGGIEKSLAKFAEKGTLKESSDQIRGRLHGTTKFEDLSDCDIIIEAIVENLDTKRETYLRLDDLCKPETIFAVEHFFAVDYADDVGGLRPRGKQRFLGMHFFNPVPIMKLVEVIRTILTDAAVTKMQWQFATRSWQNAGAHQ